MRREFVPYIWKNWLWGTLLLVLIVAGFVGFMSFGLCRLTAQVPSTAAPPPTSTMPTTPLCESLAPPSNGDVTPKDIGIIDDIAWPLRPATRAVAAQTVTVFAQFADVPEQFGSGFVFRPGLVLTATHVLRQNGIGREADSISLWCNDRETEALLLAYDELRDVAVLMADCDGRVLKLAKRRTWHRQRLYLAGYDFRDFMTQLRIIRRYTLLTERHTDDRVLVGPTDSYGAANEFPRRRLQQMHDQGIPSYEPIAGRQTSGQSGSAVMSVTGEIVGILVWSDPYGERSYFTPAANVRHVLRQALARAQSKPLP